MLAATYAEAALDYLEMVGTRAKLRPLERASHSSRSQVQCLCQGFDGTSGRRYPAIRQM
jgi:hypothetical protein